MPGGGGQVRRTRLEAVKGLFRTVAATLGDSKDEPQAAARRRIGGEKDGGGGVMRRPSQQGGKPAARGRYAALRPAKADMAVALVSEAFGPPDPCNPFEPMWQQPYTEDHAAFGGKFEDVATPLWPSPNL
jgi:hypothetical protein